MSDLVDATAIEEIVGAKRHPTRHQGRAVSCEETVYVLHSQECLNSGIDLVRCPFSLALDNGIDLDEWQEDMPVTLAIVGAFNRTRLVPEPSS